MPFSDLEGVGLANMNSGDVWVQLKPGYTFRGDFNFDEPLFDKPRFAGDHGYANDLAGAKGIFYYKGPQERFPDIRQVEAVDVAVTVAALLGIEPPIGSQGNNIFRSTN